MIPDYTLNKLKEREQLRAERKFDEADKIREWLEKHGWRVLDGKPGEHSVLVPIRKTHKKEQN